MIILSGVNNDKDPTSTIDPQVLEEHFLEVCCSIHANHRIALTKA